MFRVYYNVAERAVVIHRLPSRYCGGMEDTGLSGLPRDRLLPPRPSLLETKSSNLALSAHKHAIRLSGLAARHDSHSGCHLESAGRFSMISPRLHMIRAASIACPVSLTIHTEHRAAQTHARGLVVRANDVKVAFGEHLIDHVVDRLLGRPCSVWFRSAVVRARHSGMDPSGARSQ